MAKKKKKKVGPKKPKPGAKKLGAKKPGAKKLGAKKPGAKKPGAKKLAAKKLAAKKLAAKKPAAKKRAAKKPAATGPAPQQPQTVPPTESPALNSPIPAAWLRDEAGRERALDSLAAWVVSTLQAAQDDGSARETLRVAIGTFYDIREAASQPRGEYAGHFFIVDGVGLGDSNRPVPWQVLAETVSQERLTRFSAIFDEEQHRVG